MWPPDNVDCSKVFATLFASCKLVLACYLMLVSVFVFTADVKMDIFSEDEIPQNKTLSISQMKRLDQLFECCHERKDKRRRQDGTFIRWARNGFGCFFVAQLSLSLFEQFYGTKYLHQHASIAESGSVELFDLTDAGSRTWFGHFVVTSDRVLDENSSSEDWSYGSPICPCTNAHSIEGIMSLIWLLWFLLRQMSKQLRDARAE